MLGGYSFKEPPKWLLVNKLFNSGDDIPVGSNNNGDKYIAACFNEENTKLFGVAEEDDPVSAQGAVYESRLIDGLWTEVARITASNTSGTPDSFGYYDDGTTSNNRKTSVASVGNLLFVGAPKNIINGADAGCVYVFESSSLGWQEVQVLTASGDLNPQGDKFGACVRVSVDGTRLFVGSPQDEELGKGFGSIYVFHSSSSGWEQVQKVNGANNSREGSTFAINASGTKILGGGIVNKIGFYESGSSGFVRTQTLTGPDFRFGISVSISSDEKKLAVGRIGLLPGTTNPGTVYIYESGSSGWQETQQLGPVSVTGSNPINPDNDYYNTFGQNVSLISRTTGASTEYLLCVGAQRYGATNDISLPSSANETVNRGAVFIYKDTGSGFIQHQQIIPEETGSSKGDYYGLTVALATDFSSLAVGSYLDSQDGSRAGSIYTYKWSDEY